MTVSIRVTQKLWTIGSPLKHVEQLPLVLYTKDVWTMNSTLEHVE